MRTGIVLWWSKRDKNGILIDSKKNEYYFDISVLKCKQDLIKRNVAVFFNVNQKITNMTLCAKNIRIK